MIITGGGGGGLPDLVQTQRIYEKYCISGPGFSLFISLTGTSLFTSIFCDLSK